MPAGWILYRRLLGFVQPYRYRIALAIVCTALHAVTLVGVMHLIKQVFDGILVNSDRMAAGQTLTWVVAALVGFYLLKGLFQYLKDYLITNAGQRVVMDLRNKLYEHLQRLSLSFFTRERTGGLIQTVTNDTANVQAAVSNVFGTIIDSSFVVIGLSGYLLYLNWRLALIAFVVFPFAIAIFYRFGRQLRQVSRDRQTKIGEVISELQETIMGIRIVKAFNMERREIEHFHRLSRGWFDLAMKDLKTSAVAGPVMDLLGGVGITVIIWYSGQQIIEGEWSVGGFMAFQASLLSLYRPLHHLNGVNTMIQQALASAERIFVLLDTPPMVIDRPDAIDCPGIGTGIKFCDVSFRYEAGPEVLIGASFEIRQGELVALVGPSGAGKSTIADLLIRFYDPASGTIEVDGRDLRAYRVASYREHVAMVSQDVILFNDTVAANIAYGCPDAKMEEIVEAAKFANADAFIQSIPGGYQALVGERGTAVSGGQRQRIAIARALLKNPQLLILDEATSALDAESEALVQDALDRLMAHRTSLVIAHRLSTVAKADKIVVLDQGRVVDVGPHMVLMKRCALYQRLYALQFNAFNA